MEDAVRRESDVRCLCQHMPNQSAHCRFELAAAGDRVNFTLRERVASSF